MTRTQTQTFATRRNLLLGLTGGLTLAGLAVLLWATVAPVSFWALLTPANTGVDLSVGAAHRQALDGDITLIDIRRPDEWRKTGVGAGAQPLDMRRKDFVDALIAMTDGDLATPIALICARGVRSARMSARLAEAGFVTIIDVPEGMLGSRAGPGWLASNLPTNPYKEASR
jgi:rhodanese-related sulfurtransferase